MADSALRELRRLEQGRDKRQQFLFLSDELIK